MDFGHHEVSLTHNAESVTPRPGTVCDNKRVRERQGVPTVPAERTWGNIALPSVQVRTPYLTRNHHRSSRKCRTIASLCEVTGWKTHSRPYLMPFSNFWAGKLFIRLRRREIEVGFDIVQLVLPRNAFFLSSFLPHLGLHYRLTSLT